MMREDRRRLPTSGQERLMHEMKAVRMVFDELYGLGFDHYGDYAERIQAVDMEAVQAAANNYIHPSAYVLSVVRPCEGNK